MDTCVAVDCKSDSRLGLKVFINFQGTKTRNSNGLQKYAADATPQRMCHIYCFS